MLTVCSLEAATSRLEDMVPNMGEGPATASGTQPIQNQPTPVSVPRDQARGASPPPTTTEQLPAAIDDFDAVINGDVKTFVNISEEIGGLVAEQVKHR